MSLSPHSIRRFAGLFGSSNPFGLLGKSNPYGRDSEGGMSVADNIVLRSPDVVEPRRGFRASASCGAPINALAFKQGVAIGITYDNPGDGVTGTLRKYDPAADAWTTLPMNPGGLTIDRPGGFAGADTRFVSAQKALYFQSKYGLTKIEDIASGVCRCAIQQLIPISGTTSLYGIALSGSWGTTGNTWLANGNSVAYRFTTCRFGANGELIESAPSDRLIIKNISGSAAQPGLILDYAPFSPPDAFIRIYRSVQTIGAVPGDEMFLVAEKPISPNSVQANGFATNAALVGTYYDITSDGSLNVPLYTNAFSGGTLAVADTPAPLSVDLAWFRNRLYLLNTTYPHQIVIRILGTGTGGIQAGDSFLLGGITYTFAAGGENTFGLPPIVNLLTAGTVTQNIEDTSRNLATDVNFYNDPDAGNGAGVGFALGYNGGPPFNTPSTVTQIIADCPAGGAGTADSGYVIFRSAVPGGTGFSFRASSAVGFDRNYTTAYASSANALAAGLSWSNPGQPEGVPLANNTQIGDATAAGQRCIALKEALFIFKQDGLWKLTDDGSSIGPIIQPIDPTLRLVAPETAVALDNFILCLCEQGVVLISETGAAVNISHQQIERELFALMARVGSSTLANLAFGVAYPTEHTYILSLPESSNASACTRQYVYNLETQAWTSWTVPGVLCGAVNPDTGQLYLGKTDGTIWIERKNLDCSDYQDPGFTIASPTTSAVSSLVFAGDLRTGTTPFVVGDLVQQFQATNALKQRVTAVSYNSTANQTTVTLDAVPRYAWNQLVPLTIVKAIQCAPTFLPFHAGEPLQDKEWGDAFLSFRYCDLDFATVGFTSEKYPIPSGANPAQERINNADGGAAPVVLQVWAPSPWGQATWGRQAKDVILKCSLPQDVQGYSAQLTLALTLPCAYSRFELSAIDVKIAGETSQVSR